MNKFAALPDFGEFVQAIVQSVDAGRDFPSGLVIVLMVMLTLHGMFVLFLTLTFHRFIEKYLKPNSLFLAGFFYFIVINLIFMTHFADVVLWSYITLFVGAIADPVSAFYFVGEMYTTLGFGQFKLAPEWRILPIIISIGGVFSVSISAAALYSMLGALVAKFKQSPVINGQGV